MTILFAGCEDTGFTMVGTAAGSNNNVDATFSRSGVAVDQSGPAADPQANRAQTPTFTSTNLLWVHAVAFFPSNSGSDGYQAMAIRSPDGQSRIILRQTATAGQLKVSSRNAAGTITDLATSSITLSLNARHKLDLKIDYSGSGGVQLYEDGVLGINFSGDPRTDAATQLNQIDLVAVVAGGTTTNWSQIIAADADTRAMSVWTLAPLAAGNTQAWTPNTLANINDTVINDTTFISSSANNDISEWTTPVTAPAGAWTVKAIVQEARVQRGTTGPQHFDWIVRTASTDFTAGVSNAPATSFGNFNNQLWATNPNTSSAWLITDIAAGFNLGIKSLA